MEPHDAGSALDRVGDKQSARVWLPGSFRGSRSHSQEPTKPPPPVTTILLPLKSRIGSGTPM